MPVRSEPFVNNFIYHVFSKSIDSRKIFIKPRYASLFLDLLKYYRSAKAKISYSRLKSLKDDLKKDILKNILPRKYFKVDILAFCLMPTHFHLLLRQKKENGIIRFISDILNSFTRYFNLTNERKGPIFLPKFKSVRIRTDEQFIHVSRYIHLNPYSSNVVEDKRKLEQYSWSSYKAYTGDTDDDLVNTKDILDLFKGNKGNYKKFVLSNADYQRMLEVVKYSEKW